MRIWDRACITVQGIYKNKLQTYSYFYQLDKGNKCWYYSLHLCLTHCESINIKLLHGQCRLKRDAKSIIEQFLQEQHDWTEQIELWKIKNIAPCFDKNFKCIGDWYISYPVDSQYNFYNDCKVDCPTYVLYQYPNGTNYVYHYTWNGVASYVGGFDDSQELIDKLINNVKGEKYLKYKCVPLYHLYVIIKEKGSKMQIQEMQQIFNNLTNDEKAQLMDAVNRLHLAINITSDPELQKQSIDEIGKDYPFIKQYIEELF